MPDETPNPRKQTDEFTESRKRLLAALRQAVEIAESPFKAPEETVEVSEHVLSAIWNFRVEFSAMRLANERRRREE